MSVDPGPATTAKQALPLRLGPYELTTLIGRGGMGEVYRARDARLNRTVAIKVLPHALADNPQARTRFQREARAIGALNHPHVCIVHDVGTDGPVQFIVMEYLDGEPLGVRLRRGPLPLDQVLGRGIEIAAGLAHAHALGIVHRDIKPGNILLTKTGAKIVDFGVAVLRKTVFDQDTSTEPLTGPAHVMGTLHYMAPEQLEGREADARSDIFSLGMVLYEMAVGRHAFDGPSSGAILSAILAGSPPSIREVHPTYSPELDWAIQRCLARNPEDRWQSASDLAAVLRMIQQSGHLLAPAASTRRLPAWKTIAATALAAAALVAGTWIVAAKLHTPAAPAATPVRSAIPLVSDAVLYSEDGTPAVAISPDGTRVVYSAAVKGSSSLYVRRLDRLDATQLPGTAGASGPFFSPDGRAVAFFANGKLKKVALDGTTPVDLCDAPRGRGGSWAVADSIVFAPSSDTPLYRVNADGGDPEPVTAFVKQPEERSHRWPALLPGGDAVLYTTGVPMEFVLSDAQIVVQSLSRPNERRTIVRGGSYPQYVNGYLLYLSGTTMMAMPFDVQTLAATGPAVAIVNDVSASRYLGAAQFAASPAGSVVYLAGGQQFDLAWVTRDGRVSPLPNARGPIVRPRLSPDGKRAMFNIDDANADVGMYNFDAQRLARVTYTSEFEGIPVWTPDGSRIAFAAEKGPGLQIFWKDWSDPRGMPGATAGPKAPDEPIAPGEFPRVPYAFSPDGRFLAFTQVHPETRRDIWIAPMGAGAKAPYPFVVTPFQDTQPSFSPNGDWIIYESNESGDAIYARPFPGPGERIQLTPNGSSSGRWARNGELFYWMFGRMFAVTVTPKGGALDVGTPVPLFEVKERPAYDVTPDGQRLLMTIPQPRTNYDLVLVQGWAPARSRSAAQ